MEIQLAYSGERPPSKALIARSIRSRSLSHVVYLSGTQCGDTAVYSLSDPRDLQLVRYIGQTKAPRDRYLQHVRAARLWLPDELPWWIKCPKQRPLYHWIRDLYRDEHRLPVMAVIAWTAAEQALQEERRHIRELLAAQLPLLNRESEPRTQQPRRKRVARRKSSDADVVSSVTGDSGC